VIGQDSLGMGAGGEAFTEVDRVSSDLTYEIVLDSGWSDGAPVVELGFATPAEGAGSA
jgi:hypothetical protein